MPTIIAETIIGMPIDLFVGLPTICTMTPQQVVDHFGTVAAAARAIKIKGPSVYGWIADGRIPIDRQCQYEVVTGGALVADRDELDIAPPASTEHEERAT